MLLTLIELTPYFRSAKELVTHKVQLINLSEHDICIHHNGKNRNFEFPSGKQKVLRPKYKLYTRELLLMKDFTREQAEKLILEADGDKILAAELLASDYEKHPSAAEIHHFLWIICRVTNLPCPRYDDFNVQYKKRNSK